MGWSGCKYPFICSWQDKWQRDRFHLVFVCWLDFLLVSLAHLAWLGWQEHMFLDPDTWFFSRTKLWWPLCVSEPVQMSMFSLFIVTWLWPFMHLGYLGWLWWQKYSFLDAETWFIQGPYFLDEISVLPIFMLRTKSMTFFCCPWLIWVLFSSVLISLFTYGDNILQNYASCYLSVVIFG